MNDTFLYVFRDNPTRELATDIEWAVFRFQARFDKTPSKILVNPDDEETFKKVSNLPVEIDHKINKGYFEVL